MTEDMSAEERANPVRRVTIWVCKLCIKGVGECCHQPECVFCRQRPPEFGLCEHLIEDASQAEAAAVAREREACALLVEGYTPKSHPITSAILQETAKAIRARSEP